MRPSKANCDQSDPATGRHYYDEFDGQDQRCRCGQLVEAQPLTKAEKELLAEFLEGVAGATVTFPFEGWNIDKDDSRIAQQILRKLGGLL
jgi:hypothetical protein